MAVIGDLQCVVVVLVYFYFRLLNCFHNVDAWCLRGGTEGNCFATSRVYGWSFIDAVHGKEHVCLYCVGAISSVLVVSSRTSNDVLLAITPHKCGVLVRCTVFGGVFDQCAYGTVIVVWRKHQVVTAVNRCRSCAVITRNCHVRIIPNGTEAFRRRKCFISDRLDRTDISCRFVHRCLEQDLCICARIVRTYIYIYSSTIFLHGARWQS